ncbi:MAG: DEAD/DEAH box helicase [Candidatus Dojkabacteria bacterium]|nr:DEAD/DEAH box helicase [Candidatus Dojkabacteria bacterium]
MKIKLVKTLSNTIDFFISRQKNQIFSRSFSLDILKFLNALQVVNVKDLSFQDIINYFNKYGFSRTNYPEKYKDFAIRGESIIVKLPVYQDVLFFEFEFSQLRKARLGNNNTILHEIYLPFYFISNAEYSSLELTNESFSSLSDHACIFLSYLDNNIKTLLQTYKNVELITTDFTYAPIYFKDIQKFKKDIIHYATLGYRIVIQSNELYDSYRNQISDIQKYFLQVESLDKFDPIRIIFDTNIPYGFISDSYKILYLTDREIFGSLYIKGIKKTYCNKIEKYNNIQRLIDELQGEIFVGDYVVHEDYGIAIYNGVVQEYINNDCIEYIELVFDGDDKVLLPFMQINKIKKYLGYDGVSPKLSSLKNNLWIHTKSKVKKNIENLAKDLFEHYLKRATAKSCIIDTISYSQNYEKFVEEFPYPETMDQLKAIEEIFADLNKEKPMNRLLIGDVGFGKTEVFCRAVYKTVENGFQAAILVPTTLLAYQHYNVIKDRFKNTNFKIDVICRLNTKAKNELVIRSLEKGKIDIVIGTHRLLSDDVKFKKLGLLVIDEEQKFGVLQKEKIKKLNINVHVLSVSATPIPRTLSMALSGIQDFSILSEPPFNRKPIKTFISEFSEEILIKAVRNEVSRNGQFFFVHDKVETIYNMHNYIQKILPDINCAVVHANLSPNKLENIMFDFINKKFHGLISTTIIENGIDLPNVNTIIINNAQNFGLAQLYQLRGRVGRSNIQSYAYIFYRLSNNNNPNKKNVFKKRSLSSLERINAIFDNQHLGAGFQIAYKDLEIRGAGNILGKEQSGYIASVGYVLFLEMLNQQILDMYQRI